MQKRTTDCLMSLFLGGDKHNNRNEEVLVETDRPEKDIMAKTHPAKIEYIHTRTPNTTNILHMNSQNLNVHQTHY